MAVVISFIASNLGSYSDAEFSRFISNARNEGVFNTNSGDDFLVHESTPNAMSVDIEPGFALVEYTKNSQTWKVMVNSTVAVTRTINANSSGSNRVDAVVIHLTQDEPNSLKNNVGEILVVDGDGVSPLSDADINTELGDTNWYRLADITVPNATPDIEDGDIDDVRDLSGERNLMLRNDEYVQGRNNADTAYIDLFRVAPGDFLEFASPPRNVSTRTINSAYQLIDRQYFDDNFTTPPIGGDGSDGALNVAAGTTTLNTNQIYNYSSINVSLGATLRFTGNNGPALLNCSGNCTIAGTIDLRNIVTVPFAIRTNKSDSLMSGSIRQDITPNVGGSAVVGPSGDGAAGGASSTASGSPGIGGGGGALATNGTAGNGGNSVGGGGGGGGGGGTTGTGTTGSNASGNNGGAGGAGGTGSPGGSGGSGGGGWDTGNGGAGAAGGVSGGPGGNGGASGANGGTGGSGGNGATSSTTTPGGNGGNGGDGYAGGGNGGNGGNDTGANTAAAGNGGNGGDAANGDGGNGCSGGKKRNGT